MKTFFRLEHLWVTILTFAVTAFFAAVTVNVSFLNPVAKGMAGFSFMTIYNDIKAGQPEETSDVITIVDITYLYDRYRFGEMIDSIVDLEPQQVSFDVVFDGLQGDTLGSMRLLEAVSHIKRGVFGFRMKSWDGEKGEFTEVGRSFFADGNFMDGDPLVTDGEVTQGFTNVRRDTQGRIEKMFTRRKLQGKEERAISYQMAKLYDPATVNAVTGDEFYVDFTPTHFNVVPFDSIGAHPELITGHIVLVGAWDEEMDKHFTPLGRTPGVALLAYGVQTLLDYKIYSDMPLWGNLLLVFLFTWLTTIWLYHYNVFVWAPQRNPFVYFFGTGLGGSMLLFAWTATIMGCSFYLLGGYGINFNPALALTCCVMVGTAAGLHKATVRYLASRFHWEWLKKSYYHPEHNKKK